MLIQKISREFAAKFFVFSTLLDNPSGLRYAESKSGIRINPIETKFHFQVFRDENSTMVLGHST